MGALSMKAFAEIVLHFRRRLAGLMLGILTAPLCILATAQEIPTYAPPPALPDPSTLPTVVLMSMGGTIASRGGDRLNITAYGGKDYPRVNPEDWVNDMPEIKGIANIILDDQRAPQDRAASETFEDFQRVAKRLNELAMDPKIAGVVVTHGTNTMAETAYYMNLTVKTAKPIVLVGLMPAMPLTLAGLRMEPP